MAVQIPDPGTGNGQTGDNEYVFRKKVKDNFSDQTNAASRLVGTNAGQVLLADYTYEAAAKNFRTAYNRADSELDANDAAVGTVSRASGASTLNPPTRTFKNASDLFLVSTVSTSGHYKYQEAISIYTGERVFRAFQNGYGGVEWTPWTRNYHNENTTKDSNGFIKAASPIVKVFADKVELNSDAESQNVTYKKNGIGDYTITTVSGLSTDGWYIELPKDMNGNPKVAVTLSEVDGVISLKSYKRIFSMETFTFEPDLDNPLDIPDTRWIDLRLNEIPVEPSELETEV